MNPGPKPFGSKTCPQCGVNKPRDEYYKKGSGVSHKCKPCTLVDNKSRAPTYAGKYAEYVNEWKRQKYSSEAEFREKIAAQKKARYDKRIEEINEARRYRWANDPLCPARKYHRRKDVKDRTPKWADLSKILVIYANCPAGHEVDHIVPLKGLVDGRPVCGLHVDYNLQYLTVAANRKKRNRITEETLQLSVSLSDDVTDGTIGKSHF